MKKELKHFSVKQSVGSWNLRLMFSIGGWLGVKNPPFGGFLLMRFHAKLNGGIEAFMHGAKIHDA